MNCSVLRKTPPIMKSNVPITASAKCFILTQRVLAHPMKPFKNCDMLMILCEDPLKGEGMISLCYIRARQPTRASIMHIETVIQQAIPGLAEVLRYNWTSLNAFNELSLYMILGVGLVSLFYIVHWNSLRRERKRLARLIDKEEIANSFMRQREIREMGDDPVKQHALLMQLLKEDIEKAVKRRKEDSEFRPNPMEIREQSRWFDAIKRTDGERGRKSGG